MFRRLAYNRQGETHGRTKGLSGDHPDSSITATAFLLGFLLCGDLALADEAAELEHFERKIRPVLAERCFECHSSSLARNGLRLDSAAGMLRGGDSGPAIVPGDAEASLLISAIRYHVSALQMPPRDRLTEQVAWRFRPLGTGRRRRPTRRTPSNQQAEDRWAGSSFAVQQARQHWAFSPVQWTEPPTVDRTQWVRDPIDGFILAELEHRELMPAEEADRRTLIRRAYFDLIGLPPTPEQVRAFVTDESDDAFAQVVDELLASPQYGQRWGRHWLDVVRYADSKDARGTGTQGDVANAWRYRDWVVNAFNNDYPYDQFIIDQIAGDLVEGGYDSDRVTATAMLALGAWEEGDSDKRKMMTDIVDDQIDVVSRAIMGLTVSCARCHDHVYDPIGIEDYYALAGSFFSSHIVPEPGDPAAGTPMVNIPLLSPQEQRQRQQAGEQAQRLASEIEAAENAHRRQQVVRRLKPLADHLASDDEAAPDATDDALLDRLLTFAGGNQDAQPHIDGLFTRRMQPALDGLAGWGQDTTPWLMANQLNEPLSSTTWTIPPRSLAVHPAPDQSVAIGWHSDERTAINVTATLHDADPNGGNGIAWSLQLSRKDARQTVAQGTYDRGGKSNANVSLDIQPGDVVSLVIDPRDSDHSFDSTIASLVIESADGDHRWATADLLDNIDATNPHLDDQGRPRWHFYTLGGDSADPQTPPAGSALAAYVAALTNEAADDDRTEPSHRLTTLLDEPTPDEATPDAQLIALLIDADGPIWRGLDVTQSLEKADRDQLNQLRQQRTDAQQLANQPVLIIEGVLENGVPGSEHEGFADAHIHLRGRYDRLGDSVPRGFPRILADETDQPQIPDNTSGRLQLAQWLVRDDHPLTARVMVNRIWQHHFGEGLVRTPDNFGNHGNTPSHPQLLDNLAHAFIESGWSIKTIHRRIMLSTTYRQSTRADSQTRAADPEYKMLGRILRRRLQAEPLRDAMLAVTGKLDLTPNGPAITDLNTPRRTIYLQAVRSDRTG